MDINMILAFSVFAVLIFGFALAIIKKENTLWGLSCTTITLVLAVNLLAFVNFDAHMPTFSLPLFSGFGISFAANEFSVVFAVIASVLWLISAVETKEYFSHHADNLSRYYSSLLVTFAGALGVFYASDLFTLFVFFEIMSFASYLWVVHNADEKSVVAGKSYLAYAVFGGLSLLFGIFLLYSLNPDLSIANLSETFAVHAENPRLLYAAILMFIGFGAKAGAFMVHDWLALAHTASPAPASGLLSGLLTKTGVYGIILVVLRVMSHSEVFSYAVLAISLLNMLVGAVYAFMSTDLKRTLAYSSVSQIGFILWGVSLTNLLGSHNTYAAYGTVFHMINHSLIKILLFSLAGIVYQNMHTLDLNKLRGFGRDKLWLKICFAIGALSIMGVPLFSGYVSKTLLHEAMVELIHFEYLPIFTVFEWLFLLAGGFTFAYMLKLFICLFVERGEGEKVVKQYASTKTKALLSLVAATLVLLGTTPNITFGYLGNFLSHFMNTHANDDIHYFIWINLRGSLISIAIGLFLYFGVARRTVASKTMGYRDFGTANITVENLIYKPLLAIISFVFSVLLRAVDISMDLLFVILNRSMYKSVKIPSSFFVGERKFSDTHKQTIHITYSLAYSLLLFGIGLLFVLLYLLIVGTN